MKEMKYINYKNYITEKETILQIGSYDGVECEGEYGLRDIILNNSHDVLLIEPLKDAFEKLKQNYSSAKSNIKFYNIAIFNENNKISFNLNGTESSIVRHSDKEKTMVDCKTIDTFFLDEHIQNIDCLFLDVEGVEDVIIKDLIEKTNVRPKLIRYEFPHLKNEENLFSFLIQNNYLIFNCIYAAGDRICIRKDVLNENNIT